MSITYLINLESQTERRRLSLTSKNREILMKMDRFKTMLTDNKDINFGNIRAKYFNSFKVKVNDAFLGIVL
jgi:hypothetical protein